MLIRDYTILYYIKTNIVIRMMLMIICTALMWFCVVFKIEIILQRHARTNVVFVLIELIVSGYVVDDVGYLYIVDFCRYVEGWFRLLRYRLLIRMQLKVICFLIGGLLVCRWQ